MTILDKMGVWRAPSGRLHMRKRCSSNGMPQRAVRVWVTREQFANKTEAELCPCCRTFHEGRAW